MEKETAEQRKERLNIEASREKRLERIKKKQRDRGGIFKPREDNPFLDLLMSRDVSGRSPTKSKTKPRRSSKAHNSRASTPTSRKSKESQATERRKSVTSSVAGKQRQRSITPSIDVDSSNTNKIAKNKAISSNISRNSSRQSQDSVTAKGKPSGPSSKRPRDETETDMNGDVDPPSPPKRLKKTVVLPPSSSAPISKPSRSARKPTSKASKAPTSSARHLDKNDDDTKISKPKPTSAPKKRGRPKKDAEAESKADDVDSVNANLGPSTSKAKSKQLPASKANTKPKPATKQGTKNNKTTSVTDKHSAASNARSKTKGKGKKKAEPEPESPAGSESEEEAHHRTKFPKPSLDTVVEEDEEEVEEETHDTEREIPSRNSSRTLVEPSTRGSMEDENSRRKQITKEIDDMEEMPVATSKATKKARTNRKTSTEGETKAKKPSVRKRKGTEASSKLKSATTSKSKSKSKSTSVAKSKRTASTQIPAFANLPTTLFTSPIKAANNDPDEIDFL